MVEDKTDGNVTSHFLMKISSAHLCTDNVDGEGICDGIGHQTGYRHRPQIDAIYFKCKNTIIKYKYSLRDKDSKDI